MLPGFGTNASLTLLINPFFFPPSPLSILLSTLLSYPALGAFESLSKVPAGLLFGFIGARAGVSVLSEEVVLENVPPTWELC
jgi:hypothetical protein